MKHVFALIVSNLRAYVPLNVFRSGQETVYTKIRDAIIAGIRTMYIEGPTGMGKAFIQATLADAIISGSDVRILLLVPKITLLSQMRREFVKFAKHLILGLVGGGHKSHHNQVTVMTYQSFLKIPNSQLKRFAVMFLDEAHKALGTETRAKIDQQVHAIIIGFTATATYSEKKNLKEFLKYEAYRISIPEAVKVGMLSAIQFIIGKVRIKIRGKKKGEKTNEYLEYVGKHIIREGGNIAAVRLYKKLFEKRGTRFIMFAVSVKQGEDLVEELRNNSISAELITGKMKSDDRETLFGRFARDEFKVLVGIGTIKEGFDDPGVHGVLYAYPTGSLVDLIQGAGRGTRIDEFFPDKVAYILQLMFEGKHQVWYNDALEGQGPFIASDGGIVGEKCERKFDVITNDELSDVKDDVIESVGVDSKDIFKLIRSYDELSWFSQSSEEEKIKIVKEELGKHGIIDYWTLREKGVRNFLDMELGILGGGGKLSTKLFGYHVHASEETLDKIAEKLGWGLTEAQRKERCREELLKHGIVDYWTLIGTEFNDFKKLDFGFFGRTAAFISFFLPNREGEFLKSEFLEELGMFVGWFPTGEQKILKYKEILGKHGISDHASLFAISIRKFELLDCSPYGKGRSFLKKALCLHADSDVRLSEESRERLSEKLGWKPSFQEKLDQCRQELSRHGIIDYWTLIATGPKKMKKLHFGALGQGISFGMVVLSRKLNNLTLESLEEIAQVLGWSLSEEEKIQKYEEVLSNNGITDYVTLKSFQIQKFRALNFGPLFGKSGGFLKKVFGGKGTYIANPQLIERLALKLRWTPTSEEQ